MPLASRSSGDSSFWEMSITSTTIQMQAKCAFQSFLSDVYCQPDPGRASMIPLPSLNIMDETFSESEIYCNQLLRRKRGFPLYVPGPHRNLPAEYRKGGVQIGDVGRITPEGIFDFFFNIYLPSEHPINANFVPDDFHPLTRYVSRDIVHVEFDPGNYVSTSSVQKQGLGDQRK